MIFLAISSSWDVRENDFPGNATELEELPLKIFILSSPKQQQQQQDKQKKQPAAPPDPLQHLSDLLAEVTSSVFDHGAEIGQGVRDEFRSACLHYQAESIQ